MHVRRYPAFDPPEYVAWKPHRREGAAYRATLDADPARKRVIATLGRDRMLALYRGLLRNRLSDIALKRFVRQGVISKAWLGTGEEAATIGPVHALVDGLVASGGRAVVAPMIRNSGACHEMGMPIADIFRSYMGTGDSPSCGRDGHYGDIARGILPPISHVGDVVPVVAGIALALQLRGGRDAPGGVALTWIGDGSTKTGVAHEGLNFAAVRRLPAIFIIQNNQVALGTRLEQHHLAAAGSLPPGSRGSFADWPAAYGMWGGIFDGNNVLDAYALTALAVERCARGEGPALLVAETFRMGGHATHDEAEARRSFSAAMFEQWGRRDPVGLYESYLAGTGVSAATLGEIERAVEQEIEAAESTALASRAEKMPSPESAVGNVYHGDAQATR
ncbi:MAG: thiamine pyrophosphate-dependent dehydrogenase E1 component subunit alpha [Gemmatimonadaceae bacterium]